MREEDTLVVFSSPEELNYLRDNIQHLETEVDYGCDWTNIGIFSMVERHHKSGRLVSLIYDDALCHEIYRNSSYSLRSLDMVRSIERKYKLSLMDPREIREFYDIKSTDEYYSDDAWVKDDTTVELIMQRIYESIPEHKIVCISIQEIIDLLIKASKSPQSYNDLNTFFTEDSTVLSLRIHNGKFFYILCIRYGPDNPEVFVFATESPVWTPEMIMVAIAEYIHYSL